MSLNHFFMFSSLTFSLAEVTCSLVLIEMIGFLFKNALYQAIPKVNELNTY